MEDWKTYKISEIGTVVGGSTPSTKEADNYDGNIPWITPKDLSNFNNRYISRGLRMITEKGFRNSSCKMLPVGSILFSSRAPIGYVAIAKEDLCTNQGFKSVIPNPNFVDNLFLYYLLLYKKSEIEDLGSGTTFKEVSASTMSEVEVEIPDLLQQKKIASILSSLDDKIELNARINHNLEQMAQALYKSWFIDFEPFKDGKFVDSELGLIPEGWDIISLSDILRIYRDTVAPNKEPNKIFSHFSIPAFDNGKQYESQLGSQIQSSKFRIVESVVLFSKLNPRIKRVWYVDVVPQNSIASTEFLPFTPLVVEEMGFVYCLLNSDYFYNSIMSHVSGATGSHQRFHASDALSIEIPYNRKVVHEFSNKIMHYLKLISTNELEISKLTAARDIILPKLMSGELKINNLNK